MAKQAKSSGRGGKGKKPVTADRIREIADKLGRKSKRLRDLSVIMKSRELAEIEVKGEPMIENYVWEYIDGFIGSCASELGEA